MDLSELEAISGELLENQKRLKQIESELGTLRAELREKPRRSEKDRKFYSLIGLQWDEPRELEEKTRALEEERGRLTASVKEARSKIVTGFTSARLTVPLDPNPSLEGGRVTFQYRANATYPKAVEGLSNMLGLPMPLRVDNVTIGEEHILVEEPDPYFAKEKVVEAFDKVRKTLALKLSPTGRTR